MKTKKKFIIEKRNDKKNMFIYTNSRVCDVNKNEKKTNEIYFNTIVK